MDKLSNNIYNKHYFTHNCKKTRRTYVKNVRLQLIVDR